MPKIILCITLILLFMLALILILKARNKKIRKMKDAAYKVMRENVLNEALMNQSFAPTEQEKNATGQRKNFIHIEVCNTKPTISYVFDPKKRITIGRGQDQNTICLRDATVSLVHCEITSQNNQLFIKDMGSTNHTLLKRKFRTIQLGSNNYERLLSGDKLIIGTTKFKIKIFKMNIPMII